MGVYLVLLLNHAFYLVVHIFFILVRNVRMLHYIWALLTLIQLQSQKCVIVSPENFDFFTACCTPPSPPPNSIRYCHCARPLAHPLTRRITVQLVNTWRHRELLFIKYFYRETENNVIKQYIIYSMFSKSTITGSVMTRYQTSQLRSSQLITMKHVIK